MLKAVLGRNEIQIKNIISFINSKLSGIAEKKICILGLSFKANTNDIRNSPSVSLIEKLAEYKNTLSVYDPVVNHINEEIDKKVSFAPSMEAALKDADCMVVMTEWNEFADVDYKMLRTLMRTPLIIDTRNILNLKAAENAGFLYKGAGVKTTVSPYEQKNMKNII
jgi:UDPglucose 6-dehydrogenase